MTPKTPWGMASTIIYCLFGLPLTLMCIANLGKFFARVFRILYHTCCCGICCVCCLSYRKKKVSRKLTKRLNQSGGATVDLEALGNGKPFVITNDAVTNGEKPKEHVTVSLSKAQVWVRNVRKKFSQSMRDDVTVPVYLCLVVMGAYIVFGALLFSLWDGWQYLEGAYFCFVTLTTIGFGDYVPGIVGAEEDSGGTERLVLCGVYIFVGLALVGMCIDLMQADVLQKLTWVAQKIGIMGNKTINVESSTTKVSKKALKARRKTSAVCGEDEAISRRPLLEQCQPGGGERATAEFEHEISPRKGSSRKEQKIRKIFNKQASQTPCVVKLCDDTTTEAFATTSAQSKYGPASEKSSDCATKETNSTVELSEDFLCLPPPAYTELEEKLPAVNASVTSATPTTPASYYDDLPSHISMMTPEHVRLRDVNTAIVHQPPLSTIPPTDEQLLPDKSNKLEDKTKHLRADNNGATANGVLSEDSFGIENGVLSKGQLSMRMDAGDNGEDLLTVSHPLPSHV